MQLFLVLFITGAVVLFIKNNNTLQNKVLPVTNNNNKALDTKTRVSNQENIAGGNAKADQLINEYLRKQQPEKNNNNNENFYSKATIDKKPTLSLSTTRTYKIDDLFKANIDGQKKRKNNLCLSKQSERMGAVVIKNTQSDLAEINNDQVTNPEIQVSVKK